MDVGCGTGRHLIPLSQEGYAVVGIDQSQGMLKKLQEKFPDANVWAKDVYRDDLGEGYDLIICMYNAVLEIAQKDEDLQRFLTVLKTSLMPNGRILFDIWYGDGDDLKEELNFSFDKIKGNTKYTITWTVKHHDVHTNTTISEEQVVVEDLTAKTKEIIKSDVVQRWWGEHEVRRVAQEVDMHVDVERIEGSGHKYYLFSIP